MSSRKLSPKQAAFVQEYLKDLNATKAATRAGYSPKTANEQGARLLANVSVQAAVAAALEERKKRTGLSQDYVIENLTEVVERCMQRAPVTNMKGEHVRDAEGNHLWTFNAKGAVSALTKLGEHLGMFKTKLDLNLKGPPFKIYAGFDPEDVCRPSEPGPTS